MPDEDETDLDFTYAFTCYVCEMRLQANILDRIRPAMNEHADCSFEDGPALKVEPPDAVDPIELRTPVYDDEEYP